MVSILNITRYPIISKQLAPWVKFIWRLDSADANLRYKLLPTDCIDLIINLSGEIVYETAGSPITAPPLHINGLRSNYSFIHQADCVNTFGISFFSFGLFSFISQPMTALRDQVTDLYSICVGLAAPLEEAASLETTDQIRHGIEQSLLNNLSLRPDSIEKSHLLRDFLQSSLTVLQFCRERSINIKTLERIALLYTGYTPKMLRNIRRFQNASNQLAHQSNMSLLDIAYDNCFSDQAHFIKDFQRFTGVSPRVFQLEKATVKENANYKIF